MPDRDQPKPLLSPEVLMTIGDHLHNMPRLWRAAAFGLRVASQPRRKQQIEQYLSANRVRKLRLGAGRHLDDGWLGTDIVPLAKDIVYMDASKRFPIPGRSFDFIVCEHMIEHLTLQGARSLLLECRRVLRDGGVLRIATPDLDRLVRCVSEEPEHEEARCYVISQNQGNPAIPESDGDNPVYMLNRLMHDWGHLFLYNQRTLTSLLRAAGFAEVSRSSPGVSAHPELMAIDRHQEETGVRINEFETMVLEATGSN